MSVTMATISKNPPPPLTHTEMYKRARDDDITCDIYRDWRRHSNGVLIRGYEGIPQNLVLNICGLFLMLLVFSVLRKKAWNYGRIALLNDLKWTNVFYGDSDDSFGIVMGENETRRNSLNSDPSEIRLRTHSETPSTANRHENVLHDTGYFSWIKITYQLTDQQFLAKSGPDAVQYLSYQRHLIFLAAIIALAANVIVLPINLQGSRDYNVVPDVTIFEQSTIFNLGSDSKLLWIHEILAITFLCLTIAVMRHFSKNLKFVAGDLTQGRTILISGIPKVSCNDGKIRGHFETLYPDVVIEEINFVFDVTKLVASELEKIGIVCSRKYWQERARRAEEKHRERPKLRPYTCGHLLICSSCILKEVDALDYYLKMEYKIRKQTDLERRRAIAKHLGMVFVTFGTVSMAESVVNDYRLTARLLNQTPRTKFTRRLKTPSWIVSFAPLPNDIYWENLSLGYKGWYFKAILVNLTMILIVCFYSTPVFLLNVLNAYLEFQKNRTEAELTENATSATSMNGIMRDTVPTFLLWVAAVTMPSLVSLSDRFVGFWTKTAENRSKMIKTFTFLLFMVIILPSLGLTSATSLFNNKDLKWKCIFSPSNGSFFVNYVITSCFLGTMSELMRIPELVVYAFKLCFAKSAADLGAVRKSVLWDFQLGSQYAWMMLIFAIFILFSLVTPVITVFGFVYLLFKHFVDRYNIYFAYAPCKVDKEVHGTAINFVVLCTFMQQMILVAYTNSNSNVFAVEPSVHHTPEQHLNKPLQAFTIISFCITAALFIGQVFFSLCANFSPILYNRLSKGKMRPRFSPSNSFASRYFDTTTTTEDSSLITIVPPPKSLAFEIQDELSKRPSREEVRKNVLGGSDGGGGSADGFTISNHDDVPAATQTSHPMARPQTHAERLRQIDQEIAENHYRPGIDKPYGAYFPDVLRLDYAEKSSIAFSKLYCPSDTGSAKDEKPKDTVESLKNYNLVLNHNNRIGDPPSPIPITKEKYYIPYPKLTKQQQAEEDAYYEYGYYDRDEYSDEVEYEEDYYTANTSNQDSTKLNKAGSTSIQIEQGTTNASGSSTPKQASTLSAFQPARIFSFLKGLLTSSKPSDIPSPSMPGSSKASLRQNGRASPLKKATTVENSLHNVTEVPQGSAIISASQVRAAIPTQQGSTTAATRAVIKSLPEPQSVPKPTPLQAATTPPPPQAAAPKPDGKRGSTSSAPQKSAKKSLPQKDPRTSTAKQNATKPAPKSNSTPAAPKQAAAKPATQATGKSPQGANKSASQKRASTSPTKQTATKSTPQQSAAKSKPKQDASTSTPVDAATSISKDGTTMTDLHQPPEPSPKSQDKSPKK